MSWDEQRAYEQLKADQRASEIKSKIIENTQATEQLRQTIEKQQYSQTSSGSSLGVLDIIAFLLKHPKIIVFLLSFSVVVYVVGLIISAIIHFTA